MGYLRLSGGAGNMNQVVISVWFRIRAAAAAAVQARDISTDLDIAVMDHVIPLIMFGEQQTSSIYENNATTAFCEYPPTYTIALGNAPFTFMTWATGDSHPALAQQSCIGVQCFPAQDPKLYIHIQPNSAPTLGPFDWSSGPGYTCGSSGHPDPLPDFTENTTPGSIADGAVGNSNSSAKGPAGGAPVVSLDHWHHLLISWELRAESAVGGTEDDVDLDPATNIGTYSLMYCALDDVNKDGNDLPANWIGQNSDFANRNAIVCGAMMDVAGSAANTNPRAGAGPDPNPLLPPTGTIATGAMNYGTIPSSPLLVAGFQSIDTESRDTITGNQNAIMAELQIYTGVTLDTSVEANRRAFVTAAGRPEPSATAQALLGKAPEVLLHGLTNWKRGRNTGTAGALVPLGTINSFTPGPGLS